MNELHEVAGKNRIYIEDTEDRLRLGTRLQRECNRLVRVALTNAAVGVVSDGPDNSRVVGVDNVTRDVERRARTWR